MRIDCHLHLPVREELISFDDKKQCLLKALQANNIDYGIVIPDNVKDSPIGNLHQCIDLFKDEKHIFLMASVNILGAQQSRLQEFNELLKNKDIVALKIFPGHDEHLPNDERLIPFIELCLTYYTPFVIHTGQNIGNSEAARWNDPKYIVDLANNYPQLKIVICHYYWPYLQYCYEVTRGYKNINYDVSGLADIQVERIIGKQKAKEILEKTISDNPESVLFGSDFGGSDINPHIQLIESLDISNELREMVFSSNARNLFLLPIEN
ncbi:MAG: amidohydrolase family protein [Promethearchaeota archaeon]